MIYQPDPVRTYLNERTYSYLSAYGGYAFAAGSFIVFFFVGRMVPPPDPGWSSVELAQFYTENQTRILAAGVGGLLVSWLYMPLYSLVSEILEKHYDAPLAAKVQLFGAIMGEVFVYLMFMFITFAAYRPERDPEITQMLNDCAWFFAWWTVSTVQIQTVAIFVVIIKSKEEIFPRWFGWFMVWATTGACLGCFVPLFKSGPLAYDGELTFWFMVPLYGLYCICCSAASVKALRNIDERIGIVDKSVDTDFDRETSVSN